MANELESAVKSAAETIAKYVRDVATLTVETRYAEVNGPSVQSYEQAKLVASTTIALDADSKNLVPMQRTEKGMLEADTALLAIHEQNVKAAIEYRAKMLEALLGVLQNRAR